VVAGAEVEPSLAVAPSDPDFLVAAWQQDRHPKAASAADRAGHGRRGIGPSAVNFLRIP
jgi:hypothetical protein